MQAVLGGSKLYKALNRYQAHYLSKNLENLDESSTRIIINHLLSDVLGYKELVDIKTEYPVRGGYIDYLIEINKRKAFVVEVKPTSTKLNNKHLRQAVYYAATVGSDWIILTNARTLDLYQIRYTKPLLIRRIFSLDLKKTDPTSLKLVSYITRRSMSLGRLERRVKYLQILDYQTNLH